MIGGMLRDMLTARLREFLTETCVIEEEVIATDRYGAAAGTWRVVASGVACRVITETRMSGSDVQAVGSQEALIARRRLIVPVETVMGVNQRVTVGGDVYQIVAVLEGHTNAVDAQAVIARVYG